MLEHPVGLFLQITNMMFQGVFQEFPKLRMAYLEAGAGWVPFMMDRMEEDYEKFAARLAPQLKNPPSHFFKSGNIFVTMEVEERTAPYLADLLRPDVIMWASDFPHERERDQFGGDLPHLWRARISPTSSSKNALRQPGTVLSFQRRRYCGGEEGEGELITGI